jgi:hypothetical protein
MPDCFGCGSRYQEGDRVCKSCGVKLIDVDDPKPPSSGKGVPASKKNSKAGRKKKLPSLPDSEIAAPKQPTDSPPETGNGAGQVEPESKPTSGARQLQSEVIDRAMGLDDIHLGKGIIKPKAIELEADGFHFKYEEQPQAVKKGEPFSKGQGVELRVVNPEFAAELPPDLTAQVDVVNSRTCNHSETLEVTGNAYSFKAAAKSEPVAAEPPEQPGPPISDTTVSRDLAMEETLDALVIDSLEAELRDFETILAETRQAETDLVLEMETAEKTLDSIPEATLSTEWAEAELGDIETLLTDADGIVDLPEKVETVPELEPVSGKPVADGPLLADEIETVVEAETHAGLVKPQHSGDLKTLLQGRQSWYGIPLPYYYRLTERSLVCTEPNGRKTEYNLTMIKKVTVKQSWLGKFLGIGDVVLDFTNQIPSRYILAGIANSARLRTMLEELMQNAV